MKKFWITAAAMICLALPAEAEAAKIGTIDFQVLQSTPQGQEAMGKVRQLEESYQKELAARSQQLDDAQKRKASETELQAMRARFEQELQQLRAKGEENAKAAIDAFQNRVKGAIKKVADQKKLDLVLSEQAVLLGGTDITEDVKKVLAEK